MFLWIALAFSLVGGLIDPFSKRLLATILWAGKALVPPEMAASMPRGCADALADGWPSNLVLSGYLKIVGCIVGFFPRLVGRFDCLISTDHFVRHSFSNQPRFPLLGAVFDASSSSCIEKGCRLCPQRRSNAK